MNALQRARAIRAVEKEMQQKAIREKAEFDNSLQGQIARNPKLAHLSPADVQSIVEAYTKSEILQNEQHEIDMAMMRAPRQAPNAAAFQHEDVGYTDDDLKVSQEWDDPGEHERAMKTVLDAEAAEEAAAAGEPAEQPRDRTMNGNTNAGSRGIDPAQLQQLAATQATSQSQHDDLGY